MEPTIFRARAVHTLDPALPRAEAVAVCDGRIAAVGNLEALRDRWGHAPIDDTFEDSILAPGFVEAHAHTFEGGLWAFEYVGFFDRLGPDGVVRPGLKSVPALIERLRSIEAAMDDPGATLIVWGFDPIYIDGERLRAAHLDAVSEQRPILVFHASAHLATVNTALMRQEGFADGIDMEGVPLDADGRPLGELQEPAAMSLARAAFVEVMTAVAGVDALRRFGTLANRSGTTTVTDLGASRPDIASVLTAFEAAVNDPTFPARLSVFSNPAMAGVVDAAEAAAVISALRSHDTDKLRFGHVKFVLDGSIQGFTARLQWPGYLDDRPNGIWLVAPERFEELFEACHREQLVIHVHANGDEAAQLLIDVVERVQHRTPRFDHRYTIQHSQLTTAAQYRRMAALGMHANIFSNHIFYWGDQHASITVGPDRAARMDACATAHRSGVPFSFHSDASITPLGHLHTMWCAVNRLTATGVVLGPDERISAELAWEAATVGAAQQLKMDHEIGTIETGKRADFAALSAAPTDVDPEAIRDIEVAGTVVGGTPFPL